MDDRLQSSHAWCPESGVHSERDVSRAQEQSHELSNLFVKQKEGGPCHLLFSPHDHKCGSVLTMSSNIEQKYLTHHTGSFRLGDARGNQHGMYNQGLLVFCLHFLRGGSRGEQILRVAPLIQACGGLDNSQVSYLPQKAAT